MEHKSLIWSCGTSALPTSCVPQRKERTRDFPQGALQINVFDQSILLMMIIQYKYLKKDAAPSRLNNLKCLSWERSRRFSSTIAWRFFDVTCLLVELAKLVLYLPRRADKKSVWKNLVLSHGLFFSQVRGEHCICTVVVVVVYLWIQLNLRAQNVTGPWREPHRRYKSELRSIKHESPHCTIEAPRTPRSREGDSTNFSAAFMPFRTMKILGEGRPCGPRRGPLRGGATSRLELRDRTTDVARQHDTGRPQGDKNSGGLNPAPCGPGEHTRWFVLSLVRCSIKIIEPGMARWGRKGGGHLEWGGIVVFCGNIPVNLNAQGAQWD